MLVIIKSWLLGVELAKNKNYPSIRDFCVQPDNCQAANVNIAMNTQYTKADRADRETADREKERDSRETNSVKFKQLYEWPSVVA